MARTLVNAHQLAPFSGSSAAQIKVGAGAFPGPGSGTGKDASITMESGSIAEMGSIYFNGGGSVAYDSSALQLYGNTNVQGTLTCATSLTIGSAAMVEADLEKLDGITNGTGAANKALVLDGSRDVDTINALGIASMANNWTNASRTVADMGIVTTIDLNGGTIDGTIIGGAAVAAGSFAAVVGTTGTYSGILKTDDATEATSTTDGSLQTDGGLSVAKDAVVGDDLILLSDGAVVHFGASKDVTLTHVADVGLTLTHATGTGDNLPIVLQLKSEEDAIVAAEVIASLEFAAGDSDGTDGATVAAGIHAIAEETFAADANATKLVFTAADSETAAASATAKMTLASTGNLTTAGSITAVGSFIIGSADMNEADLEKLDGITNGTAAANKALVADGNIDITTLRNVTATGVVTAAGFTIGSAVIAESELEMIDGITAGTAAASKAVVLDGSKNIATIGTIGCGAVTSTGNSSFVGLASTGATTFGDAVTDIVTVNGALTASYGINVAGEEAGQANIWFSADQGDDAADKWMISVPDGGATMTFADSDTPVLVLHANGDQTVNGNIIIDDGGSLMEGGGVAAFTFDGSGHVTKIGQDSPSSGQFLKWDGSKAVWDASSGLSGLGGTDNVLLRTDGTGGATGQGSGIAVDDSNNMSGIGTVSCGAITATGTSTFATACNPDAADGATLGGTSAEWSDLFLADGATIQFGADQDITLTHIPDKGLKMSTLAANNGAGAAGFASALGGLTSHVTSNSPADNDYLGGFFMNGEDDNSDEMTFASVQARIKDASNGSADGALLLGALVADNMVQVADFGDTAANTWTFIDGGFDVNVQSHDGTNGLKLAGTLVTATAAQLNYNSGVSVGTAAASKAVVLDGSKNIATLGTVGCGAITSTGLSTFGSINVGGTIIGDTSLTLDTTTITTAEIGVLDGVTAGTAAASKALVLDASKDIGTIRNLTIDGTFSDGNYTFDTSGNVTGLGTVACGGISSTGDMLVTADNATFTSANADDPLVTIKTTHNSEAPARLRFVKDKGAAGADNDIAGMIEFYADDDAQDQVQFGAIQCIVKDASNGAEGGELLFSVASHDGELNVGLSLADGSEEDEIDVTIGNGTNSVVTIPGNLVVAGTTTTVNTVTMEAANAVVFEGATPDGNETTLSIVDPTGDHTQYLINQGGYIPVLAAATTTAIAATPAEIDAACDASARTAATVDVAVDHFLFCDGAATGATRVESVAHLAEGMAGAGIAGVNGQFKVDYIIDSCIGSSGAGYATATGVYTLGATGLSGSEMVFLNGQVLLPGTSLANGDYTYATASVELHPDLQLDADDVLRVYYLI